MQREGGRQLRGVCLCRAPVIHGETGPAVEGLRVEPAQHQRTRLQPSLSSARVQRGGEGGVQRDGCSRFKRVACPTYTSG